MKISPSRQRNAVSEDMALGLVCGPDSVPFNKLRVDLAFEAAWRDWADRDHFLKVNTDPRNGSSGSSVMSRANERKQVWEPVLG